MIASRVKSMCDQWGHLQLQDWDNLFHSFGREFVFVNVEWVFLSTTGLYIVLFLSFFQKPLMFITIERNVREKNNR